MNGASTERSFARSGRKMNRSALIRFAVLLLAATGAQAQNALEIIALRHRTAEQVLPALQPLVEPGGTLSGQGNQLFVRTSPANLAELRRALDALDLPQRRLLISVRFGDAAEASRRALDASGRIGNRGSEVDIRAQDSRAQAAERVDQRVQALEGARATIYTGESRPLRQRQFIQTPAGVVSQEVTVVQEMTSGFEVIPRVAGGMVEVEIAQQQRTGVDSYQRSGTTARGRLGEWFELGSVAMGAARDERGIASANRSALGETRRVWIRVDELP
jgi:type II secretory pathway component GspD/PulD (secretin)